jgi:predicted aconitase with swiveling domain
MVRLIGIPAFPVGEAAPASRFPGGRNPAALLSTGVDTFFALASLAAEELYGRPIPVFALAPQDFARLESGRRVRLHPQGRLEFL